jgi:hypothetical protein
MRRSLGRAKLMVTGGFRTRSGMESALAEDGVDVIGLGRPLCVDPDAPGKILRGELSELPRWENRLALGPGWLGPRSPFGLLKAINGFGAQSWYYEQLRSLAETAKPKPKLGLLSALITDQRLEAARTKALQSGA